MLEHAPDLFATKNEVENFFNIDLDIVRREAIYEDEESEKEERPEEASTAKNVPILEAIQCLRVIRDYYENSENHSKKIHSFICELEKDLDKKYLNSRYVQKTLFGYGVKKENNKQ